MREPPNATRSEETRGGADLRPTSGHLRSGSNAPADPHPSSPVSASPRPRVPASPHPPVPPRPFSGSAPTAWLFSARVDLSVFLGSAVVSFIALWIGARTGVLYDDPPDWAWIPAVLLIDVAHVYSTGFRVYLDGDELRRRPWLYTLVPVLGFLIGVALYSEGELVFWRALAYVAVFHFVRQQYGWVALYRARAEERDKLGRWIDTVAIYAATIYPLIYWHTHLPRKFWWFLAQDFASIPLMVERITQPIYWLALGVYATKSLYGWLVTRRINAGKDIVVVTTALCWYVGIVGFNSDYAFTVTNVIIHGVPYLALIYWYGRTRWAATGGRGAFKLFAHGPAAFLFVLWALAYFEEMFWDRGVWQDRSWFFGAPWDVTAFKVVIVPLLALPQIVHYVLDGFVWRRKSNPDLGLVRSSLPRNKALAL
ncbi:MAG TPA: hypothetical protein VJH03_12820 [Blastocatellia bacterium]|nr:hypothetical protein [Blastocatellia bacterium]